MSNTLPAYVIVDANSVEHVYDSGVITTQMDSGMTRRRVRNVRPILTFSCSLIIRNRSNLDSFRTWWSADIKNGVDWFSMQDPITNDQKRVRFVEPAIVWKNTGYDVWSASVSMERLS